MHSEPEPIQLRPAAVPTVGRRPRRRGRSAVVFDVCLAVALLLAGLPTVFHQTNQGVALVLDLALTLPLIWRRRWPTAVFAVIALAAFVRWVVNERIGADVALLVAFYTVAAREGRQRTIAAAAVLELGVVLATVRWVRNGFGNQLLLLVLLSGMVTAAGFIGANIRTRRAYLASIEDRNLRLELERDQQAQISAAAERARIAREMHDIVAHNLSVMIALADGAALTADDDPARATSAMQQVSATGRQALTEMRRLLGVLRDDGPAILEPQPGLIDLETLLTQVRLVGLRGELVTEGRLPALPAGLQLTIYRLVAHQYAEACDRTPDRDSAAAVLRRERTRSRGDRRRRRSQSRDRHSCRPRHQRHARTRRGLRRHRRSRPAARPRLAGTRPVRPARIGCRFLTITVLLVDDQELLRSGFRMVLDAHDGIEVVGEASNGDEAVQKTAELSPDVVVMDVRMPGTDGIQATRLITERHPASRVLILTTFDLDEYAFAGLRAGASGFLLKDVPPAELVSAIRSVATGDAVVAPRVTRRLLETFAGHLPDPDSARAPDSRLAKLTEREREVLGEVALGLSNLEIALRLSLSEATVKTHVGRILAKLSLRDRVQAVVFAYENRLVRPS